MTFYGVFLLLKKKASVGPPGGLLVHPVPHDGLLVASVGGELALPTQRP